MPLFATKRIFLTLGTESLTPSPTHASQDCYICTAPLDLTPHPTIHTHTRADSLTDSKPDTYTTQHPAIRIIQCSHVHGRECLIAWLEVGNSCPKCGCLLFEVQGREGGQVDVKGVVEVPEKKEGSVDDEGEDWMMESADELDFDEDENEDEGGGEEVGDDDYVPDDEDEDTESPGA